MAAGIATGNATFETEVPDRAGWDAAHRDDLRLVCTDGDPIIEWAANTASAQTRRLHNMPGASEHTRQVKTLNANWVAGEDGEDGQFKLMMITDDDEQHFAAPSPAAVTALISLTQAPTVLLWDPDDRTLIAANIVGRMPWTDRFERPAN